MASVEKKECFNSVFDPIYNRLWLDIIDEEKIHVVTKKNPFITVAFTEVQKNMVPDDYLDNLQCLIKRNEQTHAIITGMVSKDRMTINCFYAARDRDTIAITSAGVKITQKDYFLNVANIDDFNLFTISPQVFKCVSHQNPQIFTV